MCNRFRVSAKQLEIAERYGVDPATLFPEPDPLPPPELFPKRFGWVVRSEGGQRRLDVMRWGHAMIRPRPSFIWGSDRAAAARPFRGVHFANADLSGVGLFEEAFYHGVRAAEEVMRARGMTVESSL